MHTNMLQKCHARAHTHFLGDRMHILIATYNPRFSGG